VGGGWVCVGCGWVGRSALGCLLVVLWGVGLLVAGGSFLVFGWGSRGLLIVLVCFEGFCGWFCVLVGFG